MKKYLFSISALGVAGLCVSVLRAVPPEAPRVPQTFPADVTQHHKNASRDGLYLDPLFTQAAAVNLTRDLNFDGTIVGNVYAQPLYIDATSSPNGAMVIAVTESNNVYALNATNGSIIWQRNVGTPITSGLPCGNITPVGITATPVVDLASHTLFLDAEVNGIGHQIFSLNFDTGATNSGWPVTLNTAVSGFTSSVQSSRAALGILGNTLYVPYGGRFGDCGSYRGRLVGVQMNNPTIIGNWATTVTLAGVWGPGGVASDGTNLFVTTGNGSSAVTWGGAEAVIRLQPGPVFSGSTVDFWAPTNWMTLDAGDTDLGGSGPIIVDVAGATPSALVVAIGKDRNAYLLNRSNLGGVSAPVAQAVVSTGTVIGAAAAYRTSTGTFVVLRPVSGTLTAFRITATNPPTIATGWSVASSGRTAPFVTTTDGTTNVIVWAAGSDGRLRGYNGEDGAVLFNGGGANELMTGIRSFNTGIAARGRIYYAADNKVYAFALTQTPPSPTPTATVAPSATPTPTCVPNSQVFNATLTGSQEVPPTGSTATGSAIVVLNQAQTMITVDMNFAGLAAPATMAHIHAPGGPGVIAPIVINFTGFPAATSGTYSNSFAITPTQVSQLQNGLAYVNIHNGTFSSGEIRGQLTLFPCPPVATPTPTPTLSPGITPSPIPTATPSATPTATPSATPTATPSLTPGVTATPTATPAQAVNLSTRMFVQAGDNAGIGGFIISGSAPKHVLVRVIGPSLTQFGVPNALADPVLELHGPDGFATINNDNWGDDPAQQAAILATGLAPTNNLESAIDATLNPGAYTAVARGKSNSTGVSLIEVFDLSQAVLAKLANISTRAFVNTGDNIVIAGFILGGNNGNDRIVVRGIGPSLTAFGVPNALANPTLELRDNNAALIFANNDWQDDSAQAAELIAAGLAPTNPLESGIATALPPGLYTALLAGFNNATGVGVVEVYDRGAP
jgi:outer membrane protein assembly factor BamB